MKKKINLNSLKINSFITDTRATLIRGGEKTKGFCQSVDNICASQGAQVCSNDSC